MSNYATFIPFIIPSERRYCCLQKSAKVQLPRCCCVSKSPIPRSCAQIITNAVSQTITAFFSSVEHSNKCTHRGDGNGFDRKNRKGEFFFVRSLSLTSPTHLTPHRHKMFRRRVLITLNGKISRPKVQEKKKSTRKIGQKKLMN